MKQKKVKRAQINATDMLVAVFIFSLLLSLIMLNFNNYNVSLLNNIEREKIISEAIAISDALVKTAGIPSRWNSSNVLFLGLADSDRKISEKKAKEFCKIPYNETRKMLNLQYHFYFFISSLNGTKKIGYGRNPENKSKIINIRRYIIYENESENEKAILDFALWR